MKKKKLLFVLLIGLVLALTTFIFANSLMDSETSHEMSGGLIDLLFLREWLDNPALQLIVRKIAHGVEFFALGAAVMGLVLEARRQFQKKPLGTAFFYVLFIAVIDEHIQRFSNGRTSSTSDILLDFFSAAFAFVVVWGLFFLISRRKMRKFETINE
ncbi:MAG: VanZ family protein [Clostridia bacterium]|nr:VanZ family protein [Clostridia bacterium]